MSFRGGVRNIRGGGSEGARSRYDGGNGRPENSIVKLSKQLSYVLRHTADKEGLKLQADGYVKLDELLKLPRFNGISVENIKRVVNENDKQRFNLISRKSPNGNGEILWIRANQGHTLHQVNELELEHITDPTKLPQVIHGSYLRNWNSIKSQGLSKMKRNHIHFAIGRWGDKNVKSGMRSSCDLFIYVNVTKAMADGVNFYRSSNGVILTDGLKGILDKKYFQKVVDKNESVLYFEENSAESSSRNGNKSTNRKDESNGNCGGNEKIVNENNNNISNRDNDGNNKSANGWIVNENNNRNNGNAKEKSSKDVNVNNNTNVNENNKNNGSYANVTRNNKNTHASVTGDNKNTYANVTGGNPKNTTGNAAVNYGGKNDITGKTTSHNVPGNNGMTSSSASAPENNGMTSSSASAPENNGKPSSYASAAENNGKPSSYASAAGNNVKPFSYASAVGNNGKPSTHASAAGNNNRNNNNNDDGGRGMANVKNTNDVRRNVSVAGSNTNINNNNVDRKNNDKKFSYAQMAKR